MSNANLVTNLNAQYLNGIIGYDFNAYTKALKATSFDFRFFSGDGNHSLLIPYAGGLNYDGYTVYHSGNLINPVTGTGTANYIPKFTGTGTIGNSQIFDDGTSVYILKSSAALYINGTDSAGSAVLVGRQASSNKWLIGGYNSAYIVTGKQIGRAHV